MVRRERSIELARQARSIESHRRPAIFFPDVGGIQATRLEAVQKPVVLERGQQEVFDLSGTTPQPAQHSMLMVEIPWLETLLVHASRAGGIHIMSYDLWTADQKMPPCRDIGTGATLCVADVMQLSGNQNPGTFQPVIFLKFVAENIITIGNVAEDSFEGMNESSLVVQPFLVTFPETVITGP